MDIIFNCPHCEQEMAVDSTGAGSEIQCPACSQKIMIPAEAPPAPSAPHAPPAPEPAGHAGAGHQPSHTITSSAAAKVEMHLKVPVRDKPSEVLIAKPKAPVETAARSGERKIRVRTIRHAHCVEAGHDKFDERTTEFLTQVGEANLIGVHVIIYTHFDVSIQKMMDDYGLMIVYRG
jgi:DNA-directed RNA polymerase subunit RPC12/RpoP